MYRKESSVPNMYLSCPGHFCELAIPLYATVRHDPKILIVEKGQKVFESLHINS